MTTMIYENLIIINMIFKYYIKLNYIPLHRNQPICLDPLGGHRHYSDDSKA